MQGDRTLLPTSPTPQPPNTEVNDKSETTSIYGLKKMWAVIRPIVWGFFGFWRYMLTYLYPFFVRFIKL